jgi:penicillin G amidase
MLINAARPAARYARSLLACLALLGLSPASAEERVTLHGLKQDVEILRDRWGVPHIYAKNADDLFFAQGYMAARDRLFQIDLWRRAGIGRLAEVLGPGALPRDRLARLVRFRGDWKEEWRTYAPDAEAIAIAFTSGINGYITSLGGERPAQFEAGGYDPGLWKPEDVASRIAGLVMVHNFPSEVQRTLRVQKSGLAREAELFPPDPGVILALPDGLDPADISADVLRDFQAVLRGSGRGADAEGSNNWVVDATKSVTGNPLLANDPHRPILLPSLRKTVHLVAPGWNVMGAGEPALPGVAIGHNEQMGFGFTIVGIDQADLYIERLNPDQPDQYWFQGAWKRMEIERETIPVKGAPAESVELRYTIHGPVLSIDRKRGKAVALKWVGSEPGGAGYLGALRLCRAQNWKEFLEATGSYRVPSENLVYADRDGNIGWVAAGAAPVRKGWTGLFPVPGDSGKYEWQGYLPLAEHPQLSNPPAHFIATANHNILPAGYPHLLSYEWAPPYRFQRIQEMLASKTAFSVRDFEQFQQDVTSVPARRFQQFLKGELPHLSGRAKETAEAILRWDCVARAGSREALLYEVWIDSLYPIVFSSPQRPPLAVLFQALETREEARRALGPALETAWARMELRLGKDAAAWTWGAWHQVRFGDVATLARPGDANTVNAASGSNLTQTDGASYRQILDVSNWDQSVMTNVPGESGDPASPHYRDLLDGWNSGTYHPMVYSRAAVEAAVEERIRLTKAR